eukprot:786053-Amphidinium_carterae.1
MQTLVWGLIVEVIKLGFVWRATERHYWPSESPTLECVCPESSEYTLRLSVSLWVALILTVTLSWIVALIVGYCIGRRKASDQSGVVKPRTDSSGDVTSGRGSVRRVELSSKGHLCAHITGARWVILTPDGDVYAETLSRDNPDVSDIRV